MANILFIKKKRSGSTKVRPW